jgi:hypothetical protein
MIGGETPCPCCRQQFLKWPEDDEPLEPTKTCSEDNDGGQEELRITSATTAASR